MTRTDASAEAAPARRAPAMSPEDRRAQIVDAAIPLVMAHGVAVTSRQIAEAAGVAEGTVFRAFGDKDAVIEAAVTKYLDPEPLREQLRRIDPNVSLEFTVRQVVAALQDRFHGMFTMMAALGRSGPPERRPSTRADYTSIVTELLEPELDRLRVPADRVAPFLRLLAFASSIEVFQASMPIELDELIDLAVNGIAGEAPAMQASVTSHNKEDAPC
ncbi:TetR/AcrR family transcriptional regulator [Gryllotalpicola daejeonensis]|uniref:TetR/AcrR family transcriptional regulator n=1 Tax=Gryllotalpicola daejeonensis TaxID=993087 RepID=UPI0031D24B87